MFVNWGSLVKEELKWLFDIYFLLVYSIYVIWWYFGLLDIIKEFYY